MVIILTAVSAALMTTFDNQNFFVGTETNSQALGQAKKLLESAKAQARKDFRAVNPIPDSNDGYYRTWLDVGSSPLLNDYFTKKIESHAEWTDDSKIVRRVKLSALVSDFENAIGGDTCNSHLSGDWTRPQVESMIDFSDIAPTSKYSLTDVDVYKNRLYATVGKTTNPTDPTIFVFDTSDTSDLILIGKADNAPSVTSGLSAIRVAEDPDTDKVYAYTASSSTSNYTSCNSVSNPACGQLVIFEVTNPTPIRHANVKLVSSPSIIGSATGTSISYKNGYIFLGLEKTNGPEFHIIDMHTPGNIHNGPYTSVSSREIGHGINAIVIHDRYAYLATVNDISSDQELKILDISNPGNPYPGPIGNPYGFNSSIGGGNGKSISIVGDRLHLGKTGGASLDFYVLDITTPTSALLQLGGIDIGTSNSVDGVITRDYLSFILTNSDMRIFNISDPSHIMLWGSYVIPGLYISSYAEPSIDCEGNRIFISSNNQNGQGAIYILKPGS